MQHSRLSEPAEDSAGPGTSVMTRTSGSVAPMGGAEAGHAMPDYPVSLPITDDYDWEDDFDFASGDELPEELKWPDLGSAAADDEPPGEPNEAWFDDPDADYPEVVDYMKRLYAHCQSSDEFVASLKGLFPDLEEKVAKWTALGTEELGDYELSTDADIASGRGVTYLSGAEFLAAMAAHMTDPARE